MKKIAVLAITKNGIDMSLRIKEHFSDFEIFAPVKIFQIIMEKFNGMMNPQPKNELLIYSKVMMA